MTKPRFFIIASIVLVFLLIGLVYFSNPPSHAVLSELRKEGNKIINQIEAYKKTNKEYPNSLSQLRIELDKKHYGGWKYTPDKDSKSFALSIGGYEEYLFELYWSSNPGEWYLDS